MTREPTFFSDTARDNRGIQKVPDFGEVVPGDDSPNSAFAKTVSDTSFDIDNETNIKTKPFPHEGETGYERIQFIITTAKSPDDLLLPFNSYPEIPLVNERVLTEQKLSAFIDRCLQEKRVPDMHDKSKYDVKGMPLFWEQLQSSIAKSISTQTVYDLQQPILGDHRESKVIRSPLFGKWFGKKEVPKNIQVVTPVKTESSQEAHTVLRSPLTKKSLSGRFFAGLKKAAIGTGNVLAAWQDSTEAEHKALMQLQKERKEGPIKRAPQAPRLWDVSDLSTKENSLHETFSTPSANIQEKTLPEKLSEQIFNGKLYTPHLTTATENLAENRSEREVVPNPEQLLLIEKAFKGIQTVENTTAKKRLSTMEKLGTYGKKMLSYFDGGAKFFDSNVSWQTRTTASIGLLAAGFLSSAAAPAMITVIATGVVAMRVLSAAATYTAVQKMLEKKYIRLEEEGKGASDLTKVGYGVAAIVGAAAVGQLVGQLFDYIQTHTLDDVLQPVTDLLKPEYEPIMGTGTDTTPLPTPATPDTTFASDIFGEQATNTTAPAPVNVEAVTTLAQNPEAIYQMVRGDSLWSALRKTLTTVNYEGFSQLSSNLQETKIREIIEQIAKDPSSYGITSGDINKIPEKVVLDFSKIITK